MNGVNSNIAFVLYSGRTRVETRVDTVGAADYVRKQKYKIVSDRKQMAETALVEQVEDREAERADRLQHADRLQQHRPQSPSKITDAAGASTWPVTGSADGGAINRQCEMLRRSGLACWLMYFDTFSPTGEPGTITDPRGNTTVRTFDSNAWISEETDPRDNTTSDHDM